MKEAGKQKKEVDENEESSKNILSSFYPFGVSLMSSRYVARSPSGGRETTAGWTVKGWH
jgi:hypothetical protein